MTRQLIVMFFTIQALHRLTVIFFAIMVSQLSLADTSDETYSFDCYVNLHLNMGSQKTSGPEDSEYYFENSFTMTTSPLQQSSQIKKYALADGQTLSIKAQSKIDDQDLDSFRLLLNLEITNQAGQIITSPSQKIAGMSGLATKPYSKGTVFPRYAKQQLSARDFFTLVANLQAIESITNPRAQLILNTLPDMGKDLRAHQKAFEQAMNDADESGFYKKKEWLMVAVTCSPLPPPAR